MTDKLNPRRTRKENLLILKGITCTHKQAKYVACSACKKAGRKVCRVECDCGLSWMFSEGVNG